MSAQQAKENTAIAQPLAVYQLKVTLKESSPAIWRRIQVPRNITLHQLHQILQVVMGWFDAHLHGFYIRNQFYGDPSRDDDTMFIKTIDDSTVTLAKVMPESKRQFTYTYDFGDSWDHEIRIERIIPPEPGQNYPVCTGGARACPPEDVGGIYGYYDFLKAIQNPRHPEHKEMLDWIGGEFDPEWFSTEEINVELGAE